MLFIFTAASIPFSHSTVDAGMQAYNEGVHDGREIADGEEKPMDEFAASREIDRVIDGEKSRRSEMQAEHGSEYTDNWFRGVRDGFTQRMRERSEPAEAIAMPPTVTAPRPVAPPAAPPSHSAPSK
ncbi:MAG TPA: hypothetical protein VGO93_07690, partial [Candidatus Xenobia bacterium]